MPTRIDLELTSDRGDGTWTWRKPKARNPKGVVDASLLPTGVKVGDVLRGEAEFMVDGIEIVSVSAPKERKRNMAELLEVKGPERKEQLVTTQLFKGSKGGGRGRGRGRDGDFGGRGGGGGRDDFGGGRGGRSGGGGGGRGRGGREDRPRPERLRPQRQHRNAWLDSLPAEQRPVGEQLIQGGVPAVREALDAQNATARAAGGPEIAPDKIVALAEGLVPDMRTAEWRDKAEAALAGVDKVDLRDLRPVVVASQTAARTDETRALAEDLRAKVDKRVEREHESWLGDLKRALADGRTIRALRSSARPVKVGAPLPDDVATKLVEAANAAFEPDAEPDRWTAVLDAVAFSPVRQLVKPAEMPDEESKDILAAVKKLANRVPQIAAMFGIEPRPATAKGRGRKGGDKKKTDSSPTATPKPGTLADEAPTASAEPELEAGESIITVAPETDEPQATSAGTADEQE